MWFVHIRVNKCVLAGRGTDTGEARGNGGWQKRSCHFLPELDATSLICTIISELHWQGSYV